MHDLPANVCDAGDGLQNLALFEHLVMLDFGDRPPSSHTFDRGRQPSTAHNGRRRQLRAVNDRSERYFTHC